MIAAFMAWVSTAIHVVGAVTTAIVVIAVGLAMCPNLLAWLLARAERWANEPVKR